MRLLQSRKKTIMPRKARKVGAGHKRKQAGKSWGSFWNGVKSAGNWVGNQVKDNIGSIASVVKDNKLVSKGLNLASSVGVPYAGAAANVAGKLGYGRRRGKGMRGRGNMLDENTKVMLM